jgi:hypothetical protein
MPTVLHKFVDTPIITRDELPVRKCWPTMIRLPFHAACIQSEAAATAITNTLRHDAAFLKSIA